MAKRLRKKLEELESDLSKLLEHPMDATLPFLFQEIERRLTFLKNLLSSEIETHNEHPHYLRDLALRIALLERAFREWTEITAGAPHHQEYHFDAQISVPDSPPDIDEVETHSVCSCTKPSPFTSEEDEEVTAVGEGEGEYREKKKKKKKKKKKVLLGKRGLAMAIVTAILAVWLATGSFSPVISGYYEENEFLAPT